MLRECNNSYLHNIILISVTPLSAAEKMRRKREKLKEAGKYDEYKEKVKQACRKTRQKKREIIEKLPASQKDKMTNENRRKIKERVRKHRLKKQKEQTNK